MAKQDSVAVLGGTMVTWLAWPCVSGLVHGGIITGRQRDQWEFFFVLQLREKMVEEMPHVLREKWNAECSQVKQEGSGGGKAGSAMRWMQFIELCLIQA